MAKPTTANQPKLESPERKDAVVEVNDSPVAAQVSPAAPEYENIVGDRDKVEVSETRVSLDTVITDPSSPDAVVVPPEGIGSLDLPIHALNAKTPEQQFADGDAPEAEVVDDKGKLVPASEVTGDKS